MILEELEKQKNKILKWAAGKPEDDTNHETLVLNIPNVVLFTSLIKKGEPSSAFLFNLMILVVRTNKPIEKIAKKNTGITTYKSQLEAKFQKMEQAIASMQQNYSSFLSS